ATVTAPPSTSRATISTIRLDLAAPAKAVTLPPMIQHLTSIWRYRHFWLSLVRLDLRNRYRHSVLGIGWSLLNPLAMTAVWCVAFGQILGQGDWRSLAPTLLVGMAVWEFLRNA